MSWEQDYRKGIEYERNILAKEITALRVERATAIEPVHIVRFDAQLEQKEARLAEIKVLLSGTSTESEYVGNDVYALLEKLKQLLSRTRGKDQQQVGEWIRQLESPSGGLLLAKIRFESDRMKEGLENIQPVDYQNLKIWLNRRQQRDAFRGHLRASCTKADKVSPVLFCMTGHIELDGLADAAEMLRRFHIDDLMRVANREYIKLWDSRDSLGLSTPRDARNAYESLMQDAFDLGFFADDAAISSALEQHHQHHIALRCRVRKWTEEGLAAFF